MSSYSRRKEPVENRRLLLDAARQVVAERGVEKLTLDVVAKRAALSKGGLLHHFPTKDALIEALFLASLEDYSAAIQAGIRHGQAPHMAYLQAALEDHPDEVQHTRNC